MHLLSMVYVSATWNDQFLQLSLLLPPQQNLTVCSKLTVNNCILTLCSCRLSQGKPCKLSPQNGSNLVIKCDTYMVAWPILAERKVLLLGEPEALSDCEAQPNQLECTKGPTHCYALT